MLSFLVILALVGLLIALGLRTCLFLYRAGALRYNARRQSRRAQVFVVNTEAEEAQAIAETEYLADLVHSLEQ